MKYLIAILLILTASGSHAQQTSTHEKFGHTLNLGVGIGGYSGYYGYLGRSLPVFNLNYEFDVARMITLAPFITLYSYKNQYYWGDGQNNYPYRYYTYRETVIPIGVKGTVYLDQAVRAGSKWDFYLAGSVGFAIVKASWETNYYGDRNYYRSGSSFFADVHLGTEYHLNTHMGIYLDLSNGVSTAGLAFR